MKNRTHSVIAFAAAYGMSSRSLRALLDKQDKVSLVQVSNELAAFNMYMKSQPFKGIRK